MKIVLFLLKKYGNNLFKRIWFCEQDFWTSTMIASLKRLTKDKILWTIFRHYVKDSWFWVEKNFILGWKILPNFNSHWILTKNAFLYHETMPSIGTKDKKFVRTISQKKFHWSRPAAVPVRPGFRRAKIQTMAGNVSATRPTWLEKNINILALFVSLWLFGDF